MPIQVGDIIKVQYEGTLEDGSIFDSSDRNDGEPLKFEVGSGNIIEGFDKAVIGKEVGDSIEIKLQPSEAYGEYNALLIKKIPRSVFPENFNFEPGTIAQLSDPSGHLMLASIKEAEDEEVTIDMNHPMAGKVLNFKIKILETDCEPDPPHSCDCGCNHH
jgi:FKBP-type peptidyl-prolyl cis-trans isomerase 2